MLVLKTNWDLEYISSLNLIQVNKLLEGIIEVERKTNEESNKAAEGNPTVHNPASKLKSKKELMKENKENSKKYISSMMNSPGLSFKKKVVKRSNRRKK